MADVAIQAVNEQTCAHAPFVRWPLIQRVAFRFLCVYLLLYSLPGSVLYAIPGGVYLARPIAALWNAVCPWVAIHMFHLSGQRTTYFVTGSGDTTLAYIQNLLIVLIAATTAAVWSILDRKRPNYAALHGWLRLLVRYTLAFILFGYGFAKVFPLQFQPANLTRLTERFGDFSPMGVLWSFMGASMAYTIFAGALEVTGGLLLIFRRTANLGALVSFAVLANVVALNFCYDVPVKLYSINLLMMAAFLAAPDVKRLANVLLLNRPAPAADPSGPHFNRRWVRIAVAILWVIFVGLELFRQIHGGWQQYQQTYRRPNGPLHGDYEVDSFRSNGQDVARSDSSRWRQVEFGPQYMMLRTMNESPLGFRAAYDADKHTIRLTGAGTLTWSQRDDQHLTLDGGVSGNTLSIELHAMDRHAFLLNSRGFHWIQELPFNR